jgi:hypothetical protein
VPGVDTLRSPCLGAYRLLYVTGIGAPRVDP